jgi:hypothetical protein
MQISEEKAKAAGEDETALVAYQEDDAAVQMSAPEARGLSDDDKAEILRLAAKGWTQRQIAQVVGCSQPAICYVLKRFKTSMADVQTLLRGDAVTQVGNWRKAASMAADRGDHRPAREFIEAAYPELRPQPANSAATINIGMPGQPIAPPIIDITPR